MISLLSPSDQSHRAPGVHGGRISDLWRSGDVDLHYHITIVGPWQPPNYCLASLRKALLVVDGMQRLFFIFSLRGLHFPQPGATFILMDGTPTQRVTRWADLHSISARDLAHYMGDDQSSAYMRAWRLLTGRVAWRLDTIRQALRCFSERLERRVSFEESFGITDDKLRDNEP